MSPALKGRIARPIWEAAGGKWMGHDISSASKFRASALFQKYEAEALLAVVEQSSIGADEVTDLIFVNMKGPDYTAHAHGPDSKEQEETLAELDRQLAAYLALIDKKAGVGRSVTVITADHGTPGEPKAGRRFYPEDIIPLIHKKFDPAGRIVQYYGDAAGNQLHLDTARIRELGVSLEEIAQFLEGLDMFVAAFTEDEVRAAQAKLARP
jgi:predicted AlkP superfamily pyrophosphatase or phosphodiesterase